MNRARWCWLVIACFALFVKLNHGAKILVVVPMPWRSHHFVFQTVIKALAAKGHQIDYLTAVPMKNPPPNVRHLLMEDKLAKVMAHVNPKSINQENVAKFTWMIRNQVLHGLREAYTTEPAIKELMASNEKYDLVISESVTFQEINAIWAHKFNVPAVGFSVIGEIASFNELNGLPDNPSYQVDIFSHYTEDMNFWQRLDNFIALWSSAAVHWYKARDLQALADEVARYPGWESRPPLSQLASDVALVLVNAHHATGHSTPKPPHVKNIGGMTLFGSTELPKDLKRFMDEAKEGVIYFSLGTNVNVDAMTKNGVLDGILATFRGLKQRVLFKWSGDNMPVVKDPNIIVQTWFPQLAILAHKNTKLFITHGGLQSTMETTYFGVPIVGIPIFADQPKNIRFMESKGCGIELNKKNFTGASLQWAINEVVNNPKYKEAIMKRSALLRDSPMNPLDEAVYWVEFVLKHGKVLQPASVRMPLYQLYLVDVYAFLLGALVASLLIVRCTIIFIWRVIFGPGKLRKEKRA